MKSKLRITPTVFLFNIAIIVSSILLFIRAIMSGYSSRGM